MMMSSLNKIKHPFTLKNIWHTSVGHGTGKFYSHLCLDFQNNTVYAADRYGIIKAMDSNTGHEKWKINLLNNDRFLFHKQSAMLAGGVTVSDNKLYVCSEYGIVYALNISDGSIAWKSKVAGEAISRPVVSKRLVLIHTSNGQLQALYKSNGIIKWTISLEQLSFSLRGESSPCIAFDTVIVGSDTGKISAISLNHGQLIWDHRIASSKKITEVDNIHDIDTTPIIVKDIIYASAYNGNFTSLDFYSGQILWNRSLGLINDFIVLSHYIYLTDQNGNILAINTQDGHTIWKQKKLLHHNLTSPVIFHDYLITGDTKGYLYWISVRDGRFITKYKIDNSGFLSSPIAINDKLFIQARNGKIYAFSYSLQA
ncbi:Outer membrane protein assembly factor BamB [Candidatus Ecksteinia adelgidicola]|nr:Outer membrane protein assembly factor BamB [Candidatus Ecksteinia adelgidicola]